MDDCGVRRSLGGVYDRALVPIATLLVGCATPMLFYSLNFSEHTLATLFGVLALSSFASDRQPRWLRGVAVVLTVTAATMLRAEMLALAVAIALCAVLVSLGERRDGACRGRQPRRLAVCAESVGRAGRGRMRRNRAGVCRVTAATP